MYSGQEAEKAAVPWGRNMTSCLGSGRPECWKASLPMLEPEGDVSEILFGFPSRVLMSPTRKT